MLSDCVLVISWRNLGTEVIGGSTSPYLEGRKKTKEKLSFALYMVPLLLVGWGGIEKAWVCSWWEKTFSPYEGTDYKATPFGNDAEAKLSRKVGKASLKFKLMRDEVGQ